MSGLILPGGNGAAVVPMISGDSQGGVVDVTSDGRTITISLSAKNAIPMREVMASKNPLPLLLALIQCAVISEIDKNG